MTSQVYGSAVCVLISTLGLFLLGYPAPAEADPDNLGRVKVKLPNERSDSVATDLQGVVVLCADGQTCEPSSANAQPGGRATSKQPTGHRNQHNQSDQDFIKQRAK